MISSHIALLTREEIMTLSPFLLPLSIVYILGLYVYRMYFDRLSHIPGPKLAAATLWYEFYYDVVLKGRYTWKIRDLHAQYGPIIRISPYEIHINDPSMIDTIYPSSSSGARTEKYPWAMRMFGLTSAFIVTAPYDLHRTRRAALAPYFSKQNLTKLEPRIQTQVDKLAARFAALRGNGRCVDLMDVFSCLTGDVAGMYAFAAPYGFLDDETFRPDWHGGIMQVSANGHLLKQFGWLMPLMKSLPDALVKRLSPPVGTLIDFRKAFRRQVVDVKRAIEQGEKPPKEGDQTTIFWDVLTNPNVRAEEKTDDHLQDEAQTVVAAGTAPTAHVLAITTYHILANPVVRDRLAAELHELDKRTEGGGRPKWAQLERLPYFSAVVTEGMRIAYGVASRLQRVFPDTVVTCNNVSVPPKTPISMSAVLLHDNESIFPEPRMFRPERFLEDPGLKRYLVTFSRGSRVCAGMQLAYAECYLALACVFGGEGWGLELFETGKGDVETVHDFLNTSPRLDSRGVRVLVV